MKVTYDGSKIEGTDNSLITEETIWEGTPLINAELGTYKIKKIDTEDEDMNGFLFRLGCYSGKEITMVSKKKNSCVVVIKDGRYSIDSSLASAIIV